MPTKLVHGHELNIKVKADELKTLTVPQLSHEFYGKSIDAAEHEVAAKLTGIFSLVVSFFAVSTNLSILLLASAYLLHISLKSQFRSGYIQSEVDDRAQKKWVRIDK